MNHVSNNICSNNFLLAINEKGLRKGKKEHIDGGWIVILKKFVTFLVKQSYCLSIEKVQTRLFTKPLRSDENLNKIKKKSFHKGSKHNPKLELVT